MMNEDKIKPPIWYWIIAVVLLLWNLAGVFNFIGQVTATEESLMEVREEQREMILNTPMWVYTAFGTAVFAGVAGALFLLIRKRKARQLFILSILAAAIQSFYSWSVAISDLETYGNMVITFTVLIFGVGFFAIWFSKFSSDKQWLS